MYERVPHVTLKSIAQNPDIREGMSREEIDAAIARHAETETLFDRPYEDRKIVRVSGPFTVESLSPHRVIVDGPEDAPAAESTPSVDAGAFVTSILDNLRRAGVQNTKRAERLEFARLDPYPGVWVQGVGEYGENGDAKTVAIAIGPEFGTVGPELIRDAAKEAVKFADLLVVCGFAFDPLAGEEASTLGRLTILQARMNPDLAMGDELLKKTGTGNLFMVFGEPDIDVREAGEGRSRSRSAASTSTTRRPATCAPRRSTTSPPGSSTPTTTATPSSSATPTSPAPTTRTTSSAAPSGPTSATKPGRPSTQRFPPVPAPDNRQGRRQGHQPLRRRGHEGLRDTLISMPRYRDR